ncbi:unnamed protein product, partial [Amoebophrya sp. A25]
DSVRLTTSRSIAWFPEPLGQLLTYERTPLFDYNTSFAQKQTDVLRSVRCFLHTEPCTSYSWSPEGGQVFEKQIVQDGIRLDWTKDYRRFDYVIRKVPMMWDNVTAAEMIYCPDGIGTCD